MKQLVQMQTDDGLHMSGLLSETKQKDTIVIHIHGMQGDFFSNMQPFFDGYESKDIAFLCGENRGAYVAKRFKTNDGGRVIGGAYELFEESVYDIKAWIDFAAAQGYGNIWLSSHSLAPAKVAYYMHQTNDQRIKGIIFMSPADSVGLVKDPEGAADHAICMPEALKLVEDGKGSQLLSHMLWGDKILSANTYINLFSDGSNANIFHYYEPARTWEALPSIKVPVIIFTGTHDDGIIPVIDPHKAMEILKEELASAARVKSIVFEGAAHSFLGFETQVIDNVSEFIRDTPC